MAPYAEGTKVPADRSQAELEKLLVKYGATHFAVEWRMVEDVKVTAIGFTIASRQVRIALSLPRPDDPLITTHPSGRPRTEAQVADAHAAEVRRRWRALVAVVKAKLVAVSDGITTLEREFLADVVLVDGTTVYERVMPHLGSTAMTALPRGES